MKVLHQTLKTLIFFVVLNISVVSAAQEVIAVVNGVDVSTSKYEMLINSQISQGQEDTPEFRKSVLDVMITREILAQEALRRKINEDLEFQRQLDATKEQLLLNALFGQIIKARYRRYSYFSRWPLLAMGLIASAVPKCKDVGLAGQYP